ncbi:MAG: glycosyl hydrolase family 28 protein [Chthoniobacteraceae bacterium]
MVEGVPAQKSSGTFGPRRPQLIYLEHCQRIELDDFSTLNPPNTHCSLPGSKELTIDHVTLTAPGDSPNTDALNLSSVQNVRITHCRISTGDDNIVLLGTGNNDPANPGVKNVLIQDCQFGTGHGLSIGSFTSAGVQNVRAENITFDGTTAGIRMKAWRDRGGLVKNIAYRNITMKNVRYPIYLTSYYPKLPKAPDDDLPANGQTKRPEWRDITIEDITITQARDAIIAWGLPDQPIENLSLKNVKISAALGAVFFHAHANFENVEITPTKGPALQTYDAQVDGMKSAPYQGNYQP